MLELPFESILRWIEEKEIVIQLSEHVIQRVILPIKMILPFLTAMVRDSKFDHYCKGINGMFGKWSDREQAALHILFFLKQL